MEDVAAAQAKANAEYARLVSAGHFGHGEGNISGECPGCRRDHPEEVAGLLSLSANIRSQRIDPYS